jgi:predicted RNase H-like nuclease (RuvC/YqgF family)
LKKGDVVMFSSSRGGGSQTASLLVNLSLKAVIIPDKMPHQAKEVLENNSIPVLSSSKINVDFNEDFALVNFENLNHEIEKWKIKIKDKRSLEEKQKLLNVIDEYRAKRKRDPLNE